jgi:two-component system sensor histidine kinase PilS (NtrC family)
MDRSKWLLRLIWVRVLVFTAFVAAQVLIASPDGNGLDGLLDREFDLLVLLFAVYALSFCWFALRHLNSSYVNQAYAQIAVDLLLITWAVNRTGGLDSYFSSLYFLEIVISSILLKRRGAYLTAIATSLLHGVHLDLAYFQVIPSTTTGSLPLIDLQIIVGLSIFGFCAVGYLANFLAENLHTSDAALEESTGQVAFLQALTSHIVDSLGSGLITTDLDGKIFVFNPAAERIIGRRSNDTVGRLIQDLIPELDADIGVGHFEITTETSDLRKLCLQFSVTSLVMTPGRPTGYVWSFDDVTELREMEGKLRKQERMAAIGVMSAGIAHEIRNPLASITGSFGLLRSELDLKDEQKQLAGIIARETERLNQTINDFLLYARPVLPRLRSTRLDTVIADSVQLMENSPDLKPGHRIEKSLDPVTATVDESMMRQVFFNLASNAFKAMPEKGVLNVRLQHLGDHFEIRFEDSGKGMTPEQVDSVFLPFNSSFPAGTGLGLSIVYQIVNSHHGVIDVVSRPDVGTVITINIPRGEVSGQSTTTSRTDQAARVR